MGLFKYMDHAEGRQVGKTCNFSLGYRAGIEQFQRFMRQLAAVGADAKARGLSLTDTLQEAKLTEDAGYRATEIPMLISLNRSSVIRSAWEEANGVKPQ